MGVCQNKVGFVSESAQLEGIVVLGVSIAEYEGVLAIVCDVAVASAVLHLVLLLFSAQYQQVLTITDTTRQGQIEASAGAIAD